MPAETRIVVVGDPGDPRTALVEEAIDFWNGLFDELGLKPVLVEAVAPRIEIAPGSADWRRLETYARVLAQTAGRRRDQMARGSGPDPPAVMDALGGPIVLLLSHQKVMPFAWPLPRVAGLGRRYFIVVPQGETRAKLLNIVAHELGHALGLSHQRGTAGLMCMPCMPEALSMRKGELRPVTHYDRDRLRQIYSAP